LVANSVEVGAVVKVDVVRSCCWEADDDTFAFECGVTKAVEDEARAMHSMRKKRTNDADVMMVRKAAIQLLLMIGYRGDGATTIQTSRTRQSTYR
jgi:hypothetical protein